MNGDEDLPNNRAVAGSVSVLHEATGLNLTVAGGERFYNEKVELNDAALGTPQDASFHLCKARTAGEYVQHRPHRILCRIRKVAEFPWA